MSVEKEQDTLPLSNSSKTLFKHFSISQQVTSISSFLRMANLPLLFRDWNVLYFAGGLPKATLINWSFSSSSSVRAPRATVSLSTLMRAPLLSRDFPPSLFEKLFPRFLMIPAPPRSCSEPPPVCCWGSDLPLPRPRPADWDRPLPLPLPPSIRALVLSSN